MEKHKKHFFVLLGIYIVILIWGIILKASMINIVRRDFYYMVSLDLYSRLTYSPFNPFSMAYTTPEANLLNFAAFIPYGFLLSTLSKKRTFIKSVGLSLLISLIFEVSQVFTAIGGFAASDLMFNTLGGMAGFVIFALFDWIRSRCGQGAYEKITAAVVIAGYVCFVPLAAYGIGKTICNIDSYLSLIEPMINSLR
jgi:glycopeptide antibiotics resistance protein